jgi:hypothetical protein
MENIWVKVVVFVRGGSAMMLTFSRNECPYDLKIIFQKL